MLHCTIKLGLKRIQVYRMVKINVRPVEIILLAYLAITLIPVFWIFIHTQTGFEFLIIHVLSMVLLAVVAQQFNNLKQPKKWYLKARILYPLIFLGFLYGETDYLNNILITENLDPLFAQWEFALFGMQPALEFSRAFPLPIFAEIMYFGYFAYYLLIIFLPIYWMKHKGPVHTENLVFLIVQSFLLFYLIFDLLPVAGPQFYFYQLQHEVPEGYLFGFLMKLIQHVGEAPTAAFPSSHVAVCLILLYQLFLNKRKLFYFLLPVGILLLFSTVYIRAHYIIDCLAAILITPVIYLIACKSQSFFFNHFSATTFQEVSGQMNTNRVVKNQNFKEYGN